MMGGKPPRSRIFDIRDFACYLEAESRKVLFNPKNNLLEYWYYPAKDAYSPKNFQLRQLAALWVLTETKKFLDSTSLDKLIERTVNHYLSFLRNKDDYAYLAIDDRPSIAYNAFMILAILNTSLPQKEGMLKSLARGILSSEKFLENPSHFQQGKSLV